MDNFTCSIEVRGRGFSAKYDFSRSTLGRVAGKAVEIICSLPALMCPGENDCRLKSWKAVADEDRITTFGDEVA